MKILIGTSNASKIKEYEVILADSKFSGFKFEVAPSLEVYEPFKTFEENDKHKATTYAKVYNEYVIAEDSGLIVYSLGLPGVYSARFANLVLGEDGAEALMKLKGYKDLFKLNRYLISNLCNLTSCNKAGSCYFVDIALSDRNGNILKTFKGECFGSIGK
jgi:non-canonical purine NTP pyrophosphatase (RdgB/HAM1 family)